MENSRLFVFTEYISAIHCTKGLQAFKEFDLSAGVSYSNRVLRSVLDWALRVSVSLRGEVFESI
jgi:hypothetical protein